MELRKHFPSMYSEYVVYALAIATSTSLLAMLYWLKTPYDFSLWR